MKTLNNTLRGWLIDNSYEDVAKVIDDIMLEWKKNGNKQRRNWWDILAGDKQGQSRIIAGKTIPVLRSAQIRKDISPTENAICRNKEEKPPLPMREKTRWKKKTD